MHLDRRAAALLTFKPAGEHLYVDAFQNRIVHTVSSASVSRPVHSANRNRADKTRLDIASAGRRRENRIAASIE